MVLSISTSVDGVTTDALPTYKRGDTLDALLIQPEFKNGNVVIPPPGTIVEAWMQFRGKYGKVLTEFQTVDLTLEIVDAAQWWFQSVPTIITTKYFGTSSFDLQVIYIDSFDSLEKTITIAKGTMVISADVTRDTITI